MSCWCSTLIATVKVIVNGWWSLVWFAYRDLRILGRIIQFKFPSILVTYRHYRATPFITSYLKCLSHRLISISSKSHPSPTSRSRIRVVHRPMWSHTWIVLVHWHVPTNCLLKSFTKAKSQIPDICNLPQFSSATNNRINSAALRPLKCLYS